jgi:hypothetical protein
MSLTGIPRGNADIHLRELIIDGLNYVKMKSYEQKK